MKGDFGRLEDLRPNLEVEGYDVVVCNPPCRSEAQHPDTSLVLVQTERGTYRNGEFREELRNFILKS